MIKDFDGFTASAVVEKTSKTGFLSNKRVLAIQTGVLYYYSGVPKDFKSSKLQSQSDDMEYLRNMKEAPKCSIEVRHLESITQDAKKPNEITIRFSSAHSIERQQLKARASILPNEDVSVASTKSGDMITWTFKYQTQQIARWWFISLEQLKTHYMKNNDDQNIEKFLESFNSEKKKLNDSRRTSEGLDILKGKGPETNNNNQNPTKFRKSQLPAGLNGISEEDENQQQKEEEIQREVKMRQEKLKRQMEEKFKRQLQLRMAQEAQQKERLLKEKEAERLRVEQEKKRMLIQKQEQLKRARAELDQKLQKELAAIRQLEMTKQRKIEEEKKRKEYEARRLKEEEENKRREEIRKKEEHLARQRQMRLEIAREAEKREIAIRQALAREAAARQALAQQARERQMKEAAKEKEVSQPKLMRKQSIRQPIKPIKEELIVENVIEEVKEPEESPTHKTRKLSDRPDVTDSNFIDMQTSIFCQNMQERLNQQTDFMRLVTFCKKQASEKFKIIVDDLTQPIEFRKHHIVKNLYKYPRMTIEFAFCETTSINISGRTEVLYNESSFEVLRKKLDMANEINNKIMKVLKKRQFYPIRIPLMFLLEYRGVGGLVTMRDYIESTQPLQSDSQEAYSRELAAIMNPSWFGCFKLIPIEAKNRLILLEIVEIGSIQKMHELEFHSPILPNEFLSRNAHHDLSEDNIKATKYNLIKLQDALSKQKIQCLQLIEFCYNVRKLYRAGQGQLNDLQFWRLILKRDPKIKDMLQVDLCCTFPEIGILFEYLRDICGISINVTNFADNLDMVLPIVLAKSFSFEQVEVVEIGQNFEKYLKENKTVLLNEALSYQKQIYKIEREPGDPYLINTINHCLQDKDFNTCIRDTQSMIKNLYWSHPTKLKCYQILLSCYKYQKQHQKFMQTFRQFLEFSQFMFGPHTFIVYLYSLLGQYLKSSQQQQALTVYEQAVRLAQSLKASDEVVSLYIDMNNIHIENSSLKDAQSILQFTLSQLENRAVRPEIQAKLNHHIGQLYNLVGQEQLAIQRLDTATAHYETNTVKYSNQLINCYMTLLRLSKAHQEKKIVNQIVKLSTELGDVGHLSRLFSYLLHKQLAKLSLNTLGVVTDKIRIMPQNKFESMVPSILKKAQKGYSLSEQLGRLVGEAANAKDLDRELVEVINFVGRQQLLTVLKQMQDF